MNKPSGSAPALSDRYDPAAVEGRWYPYWESRGYFTADPKSPKKAYSIVIPPPNVTGSLHMGHALNNTLQDVLIRMKRMDGFNALWVPGTHSVLKPSMRFIRINTSCRVLLSAWPM